MIRQPPHRFVGILGENHGGRFSDLTAGKQIQNLFRRFLWGARINRGIFPSISRKRPWAKSSSSSQAPNTPRKLADFSAPPPERSPGWACLQHDHIVHFLLGIAFQEAGPFPRSCWQGCHRFLHSPTGPSNRAGLEGVPSFPPGAPLP